MLDAARKLDEWEARRIIAIPREAVDATIKDCELSSVRFEPPSRQDRIDYVLRTIKGWGVDTDDPEVQARVHMLLMEDEYDREMDRWLDDDW